MEKSNFIQLAAIWAIALIRALLMYHRALSVMHDGSLSGVRNRPTASSGSLAPFSLLSRYLTFPDPDSKLSQESREAGRCSIVS